MNVRLFTNQSAAIDADEMISRTPKQRVLYLYGGRMGKSWLLLFGAAKLQRITVSLVDGSSVNGTVAVMTIIETYLEEHGI
jgi:hypothetical protein